MPCKRKGKGNFLSRNLHKSIGCGSNFIQKKVHKDFIIQKILKLDEVKLYDDNHDQKHQKDDFSDNFIFKVEQRKRGKNGSRKQKAENMTVFQMFNHQ